MIKEIHRLWLGSEMPTEYKQYGKNWEALNPGWKLVDHHFLPKLAHTQDIADHLYFRDNGRKSEELWVQLADIAGYELIYQYGGLYVNCDIDPLRPIEPLFEQCEDKPFLGMEDDYFIVNAVLGSAQARHPFWLEVMTTAHEKYFSDPGAMMVFTTGPQMLTPVAYRARQNQEIHVFPRQTFNPIYWGDIEIGGDATQFVEKLRTQEDVYAVHHWAHRKTGRSNFVGGN